jgi:hypothetical protein
MNGMISRRVGGLEYRDGHLGNQWDAQIYTSLPPREGVWPVGGRASGYTPSLVPPRGGATSCLPRQLHLLTSDRTPEPYRGGTCGLTTPDTETGL